MAQAIINFFTQFPPELGTVLMAIFPIAERFALPVAIAVFKLPAWEAFVLVILGNIMPIVAILYLAESFHKWVTEHAGFFGKHWVKAIAHVQKKFARYEKFGLIGLLIFLSIPSPINGAFSASLIAFVLGYPMKDSLPYLFAGVVISNAILLFLTVGAVRFF